MTFGPGNQRKQIHQQKSSKWTGHNDFAMERCLGKTCFSSFSEEYKMECFGNTLLCLIVGDEKRGRSNTMHQGENYQDFLKWGIVLFLGHSPEIIK